MTRSYHRARIRPVGQSALHIQTSCRMGGAKLYPSVAVCEGDGYRFAQPILVWGSGSQEAIIVAISFNNGAYQFLGSAEGVSSSRPRFCGAPRAAVDKARRP